MPTRLIASDRVSAPFLLSLIAALLCASTALAGDEAPGLPGVDLKGLDAGEVGQLTTLLSEGACPCDPKLSLAACVQQKSCDQATSLAAYGADKFREGFGIDEVREAVVKKYLDDHVTFEFDLKGSFSKGAENGRLVIVEYADFECPHCALMSQVLSKVVKAHPKDVTVYFKHFPLPFHPFADKAARATVAAGKQGKFWPMHDLVFQHQGMLNDGKFDEFARELGLNVKKFKADMESDEVRAVIARDMKEAEKHQIGGTPTIYINGKLYYEAKTPEAFTAYVEKLLKRTSK